MKTNTKKIFEYANRKNVAICAFNVSNLETMQAVIEGAIEENVPVIVSASESAIKYAGLNVLVSMFDALTSQTKLPMALHLDHGASYDICKKCIAAGFSSVMFDGSALGFDENIAITRKVVAIAHRHDVTVEAELGRIMGVEDAVVSKSSILTDPQEAQEFVRRTGCDSLAISIGTAHGINKSTSTPKIYYDVIDGVSRALTDGYPLVAHGSSCVPQALVENINRFGGNIKKSQGIALTDLEKMKKTAICKINMDTDLRLAFTSGVREFLSTHPDVFDPRKILAAGRSAVKAQVKTMLALLSK